MANHEFKEKKSPKAFKLRLVDRNGNLNIIQRNASRRAKSYVMDIFITLVDTKWRYIFFIFTLGFVCSWFVFACFYFCVSYIHDDFDILPESNDTFLCVENVEDFTTMLLFSFETQTTIGYGSRYVTDVCVPSVIGMLLQSICGVLLQAFLTGIILTKVQKPKRRAQTILFSKTACIITDGFDHYLSIRVGDIQKSQMMDICIRAICVTDNLADDSKAKFCYDLDFTRYKNEDKIHLFWPITLYHKITPNSPFWQLEQTTLPTTDLEVIVILEGTSETTGTVVQARRSYIQDEIMWGHRFKTMTLLNKKSSSTRLDYKDFHSTVPIPDMTKSSAECNAYDMPV